MKAFEDHISNIEILKQLCKLRAGISQKRNKKHQLHLFTGNPRYNYHVNDPINLPAHEYQFREEIGKLMPSRKTWVSLGQDSRRNRRGALISTFDKNYYSVLKTIARDKKKSPSLRYLKALNKFMIEVQSSVTSGEFQIGKPRVFPKFKKIRSNGTREYRPLCVYSLKERVVLSLVNKYLTRFFDPCFEDCSYAFRSKRNQNTSRIISHHDSIDEIMRIRQENEEDQLWVIECDMKKFYDSVNHDVIKLQIAKLIAQSRENGRELVSNGPMNILSSYLDSFSFNIDVLPLNLDDDYWKSFDLNPGKYGWVGEEAKSIYSDLARERIGVPQGGALSGLIANIVLDYADKQMQQVSSHYLRFCDDMILLDSNFVRISRAKQVYLTSLKELKLFPHNFTPVFSAKSENHNADTSEYLRSFWQTKSKGPYRWTAVEDCGYPWIGFVGYEMKYNGHIRVRKSSFLREQAKQRKEVRKYKNAIREHRRAFGGTLKLSMIYKLVGMSVGRFSLRNYSTVFSQLCWRVGFKALKMNPDSKRQMRQLDRNRNRLFKGFEQFVNNHHYEHVPLDRKHIRKQVVKFNRPFSYYYHVLVKSEEQKKVLKKGEVEIANVSNNERDNLGTTEYT